METMAHLDFKCLIRKWLYVPLHFYYISMYNEGDIVCWHEKPQRSLWMSMPLISCSSNLGKKFLYVFMWFSDFWIEIRMFSHRFHIFWYLAYFSEVNSIFFFKKSKEFFKRVQLLEGIHNHMNCLVRKSKLTIKTKHLSPLTLFR